MNWTNNENDAISRFREMMSPEELQLADRVEKLHGQYFGLDRDVKLNSALKALQRSVAAHRPEEATRPDKRRIVVICGESGAGKTRAITQHIRKFPALQPYVDKDGVQARPLLCFEAPSPCSPKRLALEGLKALGLPVRNTVKEHEAWDAFRTALRTHRVNIVMIDEAQQAFETSNEVQRQLVRNTLKHLVQMPDWPVRLVLAGVSPLFEFLSCDRQLRNRMTPVRFEKHRGKDARKETTNYLKRIIVDHAAMQMADDLNADLVNRLHHASDDEFGTILQTVRGAVEVAMSDDRDVVRSSDFAETYENISGCLPDENVFECVNWRAVVPGQALHRPEDREIPGAKKPRHKSKPFKFGERP